MEFLVFRNDRDIQATNLPRGGRAMTTSIMRGGRADGSGLWRFGYDVEDVEEEKDYFGGSGATYINGLGSQDGTSTSFF
ncbi:hypothetical protein Trydic_g395 [Trypoxylus dichotomus]